MTKEKNELENQNQYITRDLNNTHWKKCHQYFKLCLKNKSKSKQTTTLKKKKVENKDEEIKENSVP